MHPDRRRWNRKFLEGPHRTVPSPHLVRLLPHLRPGLAVDVACGEGIHAAMLAEVGFRVVGVDISDAGLALARERRRENLLLVQADLERFDPRPGSVDTVVCTRFLDRALLGRCVAWLVPGGTAFVEVFTVGMIRYKPEFKRDFCVGHGKLPGFLPGTTLEHYEEIDDGRESIAVALVRRS